MTQDEGWDTFVAGSEKPHVFQTLGWGELKFTMGWRVHRLVVERGTPVAGLQVLERDFPKIGYRLLYAPRGPVLAAGWTAADLDALFKKAEALARERRAVFLKLDPDIAQPNDWITPHLIRNGFRLAPAAGGFSGIQPKCVFRLDIHGTEDQILAGMDQKTRYNIRLADRRGVAIRPINSREDIETFYGILVETAQRDGFLIRPVKYFLDIQSLLGARGQAQFFLAEREGAAIAGALALTVGSVAWYAYGASANTAREHMPNHLMQWTLIRWAKSRGCTLYDFRAVPSNPAPTDPLYGLYRFKKGFGGQLTEFVGEYDRVYVPWLYHLWVRGWPLFKKWRRKLLLKPAPKAVADA